MKNFLKFNRFKILAGLLAIVLIACTLCAVLLMPHGDQTMKPSVSAQATSVVFDKETLTENTFTVGTSDGKTFASETTKGYLLTFTEAKDGTHVLTGFEDASGVTNIGTLALELSEREIAPDFVISAIGPNVFKDSDALKSVDLYGSSITMIGENAFNNNKSLQKLVLPEALVKIGDYAFYNTILTTLTMNGSLTTIGNYAFASTSLVVVRGGTSLQTVGEAAFSGASIRWFQLNNSAMSDWGENVFTGNRNLRLFHTSSVSGWGNWKGLGVDGKWTGSEPESGLGWKLEVNDSRILDFVDPVTDQAEIDTQDEFGIHYKLTNSASGFTAEITKYDGAVTDLVIPGNVIYDSLDGISVIRVNDSVFANQTDLETVNVLETANGATIGANAFAGCENLQSVVIGKGYTTIGNAAFANCTALETVVVGENVDTIPLGAFEGATSVKSVFLRGGIGNSYPALEQLANAGAEVVVTRTGTTPVDQLFYSNYTLDDKNNDKQGVYYRIVELKDESGKTTETVAYVGDNITEDSDDERANTSRYSGSDYFSGTRGHVVIPDYVSLGDSYYRVTTLGRYSFYNCSSLVTLELGAHIGQVYDCSLRNCQSLKNFVVSGKNTEFATEGYDRQAPLVNNRGQLLFAVTRVTIDVTYDQIKKAGAEVTELDPVWSKNFANNVSSIENYAFANCTALTSFDFGAFTALVFIGEHAFENTGLRAVDLRFADSRDDSSVYIGEEAFSNCYFLEDVYVGRGNWFQSVKYVKDKTKADSDEVNEAIPQYRNPFLHCTALKSFRSTSNTYVAVDNVLYLMKGSYATLLQYPAGSNATNEVAVNEINYNGTLYPVRSINAYAFSSAVYLDTITVGENVYIIGKAAFENCIRLMNVSVGKNVLYIGMEIPDLSQDIEGSICGDNEIERDARIKNVYEQEVFQNCYVLSNIKVDAQNAYYESDTNGILYNKGKTELMVYGQGISRLTFTLPATVTKIAMEAFQYNTHIQRVNIPEGVTEIGAKAFNGCTGLSLIYFRTLYAPKIGEQTFNSTGAFNGGLHLYCIPEPDVWIGSSSYAALWEDYEENTEKYNSIEEIPDQTQPTNDVYLIYVIDADGNALTDMQVEYNYENDGILSRYTIPTNEYGYAVLSLPYDLDPAILKFLHVYDEKGVFFDYSVEDYYLDYEIGFTYITLYAVPSAQGLTMTATNEKGALLYNENIESTTATLNTAYLGFLNPDKMWYEQNFFDMSGKAVNVTIRGSWDSKTIPTVAALYRTEAAAKANNMDSALAFFGADYFRKETPYTGSHSYTFTFGNLEQFKEGSNEIWLRLDLEYGEGGDFNTEIIILKLNIKIYYFTLVDSADFSFMNGGFGLGLNISKDIPFIGGMSIGFGDGKKQKKFLTYTEDKIILSLTLGDSDLEMGDLWDQMKKEVSKNNRSETLDSLKDLATAIKQCHNAKLKSLLLESQQDAKIYMNLGGSLELSRLEVDGVGLPVITKTSISGAIGFQFKWQQTWILLWIPVTVRVEASAEGSFEWTVTYDYDAENIYTGEGALVDANSVIEFGLKIKLEVSAGIGCSLASVGLYGSAALDLVMEISDQFRFTKGILTLDIGIYLKVDLGLFKLSKKWSALDWFGVSGEINLLGNAKTASYTVLDDGIAVRGRSFATFHDSIAYAISEISESSTFQPCDYEDYALYGGVNPEIVTYNNITYQFYIENVLLNSNSSVKGKYDSYNYLKLVYRYRTGNEWSDYIIVNDDGCNDTDFQCVVDGNGIHLLVRSVGGVLSESNADTYTSNIVLYGVDLVNNVTVRTLRVDNMTELYSAAKAEASVSGYVYSMSILSVDGTIYYAWVGNTENNVFGMSNDSTTIEDSSGATEFKAALTDKNYLIVKKAVKSVVTEVGRITGLRTVTDSILATLNGRVVFALITDEDCDITTSSDEEGNPDRFVRLLYLDEAFPTKDGLSRYTFKAADGTEMTDYMGFSFDGRNLYLAADGDLYRMGVANGEPALEKYFGGITGDYRFVYDGQGNLHGILTIIFEDSMTSNIYYAIYDAESANFGNFVRITSLAKGMMLESYAYYWDGYHLMLNYVYSKSGAEGGADSGVNTVFVAMDESLNKPDDFVFVSATLDGCEVELTPTSTGDTDTAITVTATFTVSVKNDSLKTVNSFTIQLLNANGDIAATRVVNETLYGGNVWTGTVEFILKDRDAFTRGYTLKVIAHEEFVESAPENNTLLDEEGKEIVFDVVRADLSVTADFVIVGGIKYIRLMVQNIGALPVELGEVYVDNGIQDYTDAVAASLAEHLYVLPFENLAPNTFRYFTIELNRVFFTEQYVTVGVYGLVEGGVMPEYGFANNGANIEIERNEVFTYENYTLTYYVDGKVFREETYAIGATIEYIPVEEMVKEGYTFSGWFGASDKNMPGHNISVYGFYTKNVYSINYYVNGVLTYQDEYEYLTVASIRDAYTRIGYTFTGWAYDELLESLIASGAKLTVTGNLNVYGTLTANEYKLSFIVDGEEVYTEMLTYGKRINNYRYTPQEGYAFSGWSSHPNEMPDHDVYVYGTQSPIEYHIYYVIVNERGESEQIAQQNVLFGQEANILSHAREGYDYEGWYYTESEEEDPRSTNRKITSLNDLVSEGTFTMPAKDFTLTAYESAKEFTIYYIVGSECVYEAHVAYNSRIPAYVYTAPSGVQVREWVNFPASGIMPAADLILYGSTEDVQFTITYYANGEEVGQQSVAYGSVVLFAAGPEKEGYTFLGWSLADAEGNAVTLTDGRMPAYSLFATAQYEINQYKLSWVIDGKTVFSQTYAFGEEILPFEYTAPEGYSFGGWTALPATMPAGDLTIYGATSRNAYTLTYFVDGEAVKSFELLFGLPTISYEYIAEEGYSFGGWEETLPETMPAHDVAIHGAVSVNRYAISYYVDGALVGTASYDYKAAVQPYSYLAAEGFTFLGFAEEPEIMPAHDVNVYGRTQRNHYTVSYFVNGELVAAEDYEYGARIVPLVGYERVGYTFGWDALPVEMPARDLMVEGHYTANEYLIRYYCDGELLYTDSGLYGETLRLRDPESKLGYTFSGWVVDTDVVPAQDINIYGTFTINRYSVTYKVGGEVYKVELYAFGEEIGLPHLTLGDTTVTGWYLGGEKVESLKMGAEDIVLVAETQSSVVPIYQNIWFIASISAAVPSLILITVIIVMKVKHKKKLEDM